MASSSYYRGRRDFWGNEERKIRAWIEALNKIANDYTCYEMNEQDNEVNGKVDKCFNNACGGLSGGGNISYNHSLISAAREHEPINDANISSSRGSVYAEINDLKIKRDDANSKKNDYNRQYRDALREEGVPELFIPFM